MELRYQVIRNPKKIPRKFFNKFYLFINISIYLLFFIGAFLQISVRPGVPKTLLFVTKPSNTSNSGMTLDPPPVLQLLDFQGVPVTNNYTISVTINAKAGTLPRQNVTGDVASIINGNADFGASGFGFEGLLYKKFYIENSEKFLYFRSIWWKLFIEILLYRR